MNLKLTFNITSNSFLGFVPWTSRCRSHTGNHSFEMWKGLEPRSRGLRVGQGPPRKREQLPKNNSSLLLLQLLLLLLSLLLLLLLFSLCLQFQLSAQTGLERTIFATFIFLQEDPICVEKKSWEYQFASERWLKQWLKTAKQKL